MTTCARNIKITSASVALATLLFALGRPAGANLIVNGSFEQGVFVVDGDQFYRLPPGSTTMPGWTVVNDDLSWGVVPNVYLIAASDGAHLVDLTDDDNAVPHGGVTQSISTTTGLLYELAFDLGTRNGGATSLRGPITVSATAGSTSMNFTHNPSGAGNQWAKYSFVFTASSSSTPITIIGVSGRSYIGLDNVSVEPVPEPGTVGLLAMGGLLVAYSRYGRVRVSRC